MWKLSNRKRIIREKDVKKNFAKKILIENMKN